MTKAQIISIIRTKLDELTPFNEGLVISVGSEDVKPVEANIEAMLDECLVDLIMIAPLHLLPITQGWYTTAGSYNPASIYSIITITDEVGSIDRKNVLHLESGDRRDILRLVRVKFPLWEKAVINWVLEGSPEAKLQDNKYTRAGYAKPVIVLSADKIRFYPTKLVNTSLYVVDYITTFELTALPEKLIAPYTWLVAARVFAITDMPNQAKEANELFKNSITIR